jgi:hypothetical protein
METSLPNKYQLKDLFKEIDFLDRKIAHCQAYGPENERVATIAKLMSKRQQLANKAHDLGSAAAGCDPKYLPQPPVHKNESKRHQQQAA